MLIGRSKPPAYEDAMLVARQEDLGFGVLCWEKKVIRVEKIVDGRVPLPARSGYISENRWWQGIPRRFSDTAG